MFLFSHWPPFCKGKNTALHSLPISIICGYCHESMTWLTTLNKVPIFINGIHLYRTMEKKSSETRGISHSELLEKNFKIRFLFPTSWSKGARQRHGSRGYPLRKFSFLSFKEDWIYQNCPFIRAVSEMAHYLPSWNTRKSISVSYDMSTCRQRPGLKPNPLTQSLMAAKWSGFGIVRMSSTSKEEVTQRQKGPKPH